MLNEIRTELRAIEYKIQDLEFRRLKNMADLDMQQELVNLLRAQEQLRLQELLAQRYEDDFVVLVMSLPFNA